MALSGCKPERRQTFSAELRDPRTRLKVLFILGATPAAGVALFAPSAISLPLASLVSLLLAGVFGFYAWHRRTDHRAQGLTFRDLAGMLALIGFSAGAVSEPAAALELFGMAATR